MAITVYRLHLKNWAGSRHAVFLSYLDAEREAKYLKDLWNNLYPNPPPPASGADGFSQNFTIQEETTDHLSHQRVVLRGKGKGAWRAIFNLQWECESGRTPPCGGSFRSPLRSGSKPELTNGRIKGDVRTRIAGTQTPRPPQARQTEYHYHTVWYDSSHRRWYLENDFYGKKGDS